MKQKNIVKTLGMVALIATLASCTGLTTLTTFTTEVGRQQATYAALDVAPDDKGVTVITPRKLAEGSEIELTNEEKLILLIAARQTIRSAHETIMTIRESLRVNVPALKEAVALYRDAGFTLTEAERTWLGALIGEMRQIREDVNATLGLVWGPLNELRDQYTIENIDLILETYQTAAAAMQIRLAAIIRVDAIISEVMDFIAAKVG